jgi:hypothetical protein
MTAATVDPARVSAERKPSTRQVYAIAHRACELLGVDWDGQPQCPSCRRLLAAANGWCPSCRMYGSSGHDHGR